MKTIEIGRLLRASTAGCVIGCRVTQLEVPSLGGMVRIQLDKDTQVYGMIHDIHIDDDGLVRQLVTVENLSDEVIQDNRLNRNVPVEISVLFVGYRQGERIYHLLPPRPPLTLDSIYPCTAEELCAFTGAGRFGYLRPLLAAKELPLAEVLAAHFRQAAEAHQAAGQADWLERAVSEVITLLRDDYPLLNSVLSALAELEY